MKVEDLMTRDVRTCSAQDTMRAAARIMWDHDCGCVPVVDPDQRVVGMLTDRDICMATEWAGRPPQALQVAVAMSKQVWSCQPEDSIGDAEATMRNKRVRRLPVVGAHGRLVGILSLNDIAREAPCGRRGWKNAELSDPEVVGTLAAIGAPRFMIATQH